MKGGKCQKKSTKGCSSRFVKRGTMIKELAKRCRTEEKLSEQDGSVTASFKHWWVNRTKQFKLLLSYPELELADVLCLPAKIILKYAHAFSGV